jgi:glycine cleavage system H protein
MEVRKGILYTKTHEWVKVEGEGNVVKVGITDYAQETLTDVVYVELPAVGKEIKKGEALGSVESVKSVSEIYSPISGKVREINEKLNDEPELMNKSPYNDGYLVTIEMENRDGLNDLLSAERYEEILKQERK